MGRALSEHTKQILEQYAKEINYIITSTHHATSDPRIRERVANKLAGAIRMSRMRGGDVESPVDTGLYKYAGVLKESMNKDELMNKARIIRNLGEFPAALTAFGLNWKTKFPLPEDWKQELEPERCVTGMHDFHPSKEKVDAILAEAQEESKEKVEFTVQEIGDEIAKIVAERIEMGKFVAELRELKEFVKHHIHIEGGTAVVLTELK